MSEIQKQIREVLRKYETGNEMESANALVRMEINRVEWLTHQQTIIDQQAAEIEKLKVLIQAIDNETRLWNNADSALSVIQQIIIQEKSWR